jgi:hypothetical protein
LTSTLEERVAALEAHVEQRPGMVWRGTWSGDETYVRGDVVTQQGGMWVCIASRSTGEKPGCGPTAWKLCVKRGRAARPAQSN